MDKKNRIAIYNLHGLGKPLSTRTYYALFIYVLYAGRVTCSPGLGLRPFSEKPERTLHSLPYSSADCIVEKARHDRVFS